MRLNIETRCADRYEAQKLATMTLAKETYIVSILNIIRNEMIVSLKDGSAHSILLYDSKEAERLASYLQSVFDGVHRVCGAEPRGIVVRVSKCAA